MSAEQIDSAIQDVQRRVCEFLGLDLSTLWQVSSDNQRVIILTHLYRPLGGPPLPERMEAQEYFPWCLKELADDKVIAISTEDAPAEAARDQEMWRY